MRRRIESMKRPATWIMVFHDTALGELCTSVVTGRRGEERKERR